MKRVVPAMVIVLLGAAAALGSPAVSRAGAAGDSPEKSAAAPAKPVLETLLESDLAGADGLEVILSRVTLPPGTSLPKHWHPGEEFAYLLEGSLTLWQEGKDEVEVRKGDVGAIPLEQVHAVRTGDEGATVLVFRVHEKGQPERFLVE